MARSRIAFSGIGAVGGYYGGMVAARYRGTIKADILFIAHEESLKAIRGKGLQMQLGIRTIHAASALTIDNPVEIRPVSYLFYCTKSYDLEENIQQLKPIIGPKTVIIPLLNELDIEKRIHNILPGQKVWKGCIYIGSRLTEPGVVEKFSLKERILLGNKDASKDGQTELPKLLMYARLNAFNLVDTDLHVWKKFFMISMAATAMSFFSQSIDEVLTQHIDLFIALGMKLRSVAGAIRVSLPDDIVYTFVETQKTIPASSIVSTHGDFLAGKKAELETLIGYAIRQAEKFGVDVPTRRFMYNGSPFYPYPKNQQYHTLWKI